MRYIDVVSSTIEKIGYDPINEMLDIQFNGCRVYRYYEVPKEEVINLVFAKSHGAYFMQNMKNKYKGEPIN